MRDRSLFRVSSLPGSIRNFLNVLWASLVDESWSLYCLVTSEVMQNPGGNTGFMNAA